jgi:hypothetical protein
VDDVATELADALASGREWDLAGAAVPAASLVKVLTATPPPGAPALRLRQATVTGALRLFGARVPVPVELRECTFGHVPDLRMAEFPGLALTGSALPGLRAGNLRVAADLLLDDGFDATGPVDLTDAQIGGSLRLSAGRLRGAGGYALVADRLRVGGELYLRRARCAGTLRMQNLDVGATLDCTGAVLTRPRLRPDATLRPSLDLRAATIGKDLLCIDGFTATGGVRIRVADVHKSAQFVDATLGTSVELTRYSLNAYGLTTTDLTLLCLRGRPRERCGWPRRGPGRSPTRRCCGRPRVGWRSTGSTTN